MGTVELADGTSAKGFLAETAGLSAAADISAFGGWRNFVASSSEPRQRLESAPSN
ncbi:allophanate hydrolase-related protein [Mesorhizobium sp. BHbsci]